jgi:hypothetical protein
LVTANHLQRRVVLVILEYNDWLTSSPTAVCTAFPEVIVGLRIHGVTVS